MAGREYQKKEDPTGADNALIWDSANSDWRQSPLSAIKALFDTMQPYGVPKYEPVTQYESPVEGFSITVGQGYGVGEGQENRDIHLLLTPLISVNMGTIVLPENINCRDKQTVIVTSTNPVVALTIDGNGATTISGVPTAISAGGFFTLKFDYLNNSWYRIG